jgi:signal transduction histidine kinase
MHPAIGLLISLVIVIHIALPLGTWLLLTGRRNDITRLWFISISVYSLSVCSIALRPFLSEYVSYIVAWSGACASWLLMIETLRRELNKTPWRWPYMAIPMTAWALLLVWLYESGNINTTGILVYSAVFVCLNLTLSYLVWQLRRTFPSRSLLMIQVAFAVHASAYLNRLYQYALSGNLDYLNVFSFSWVSNLVTLSAILAMVLICFGYWGFSLEKSNAEKKHAEQGQLQAEAESDAMRSLVKERDQLLMLNARVSALSSLSSFSAMLVHDISQPLQALELGLYDLQGQVKKLPTHAVLTSRIDELTVLSDKASEMVSSLRRLMIRGQDQMDDVDLHKSIQSVFPILQGEAAQRGIEIQLINQLTAHQKVQANEVMLQRIVFNLAANAMDALTSQQTPAPSSPGIVIELLSRHQAGQDWVVLQIQDNGPGFPDDLLQQLSGPVVSSKAQGSGLSLLLTQSMLRLWGGHTVLANGSRPGWPGAILQLWLIPAETGSGPS